MRQLFEIYDDLRSYGMCRNQADFSRDWLGRSECYLSYLRSTGAKPSLASLGFLAKKLKEEVEYVKAAEERVFYRKLRAVYVSAQTLFNASYEMKYVPPYYWVTAA